MGILAYGSEKVQALQDALGGTVPPGAGNEPRTQLDRLVTERFAAADSAREEAARMIAGTRDRLFGHIPKDDPDVKRDLDQAREYYERRLKRTRRQPAVSKVEPCFVTGSNFWFKAPPYDDAWTATPSGSADAHADKAAGNYDLAVQSIGDGSHEAAAGVGTWFFCTTTDPAQRVAALLEFSDDWWDSAMGYVAHNDLRTRLWVWGDTEQAWVVRSDVSPSWSDGVGWFESHGNDPAGDDGRIAIETFFPAQANQWYEAWVWSDASTYADGGFWGIAASSIQFSATVPDMVFGSLF